MGPGFGVWAREGFLRWTTESLLVKGGDVRPRGEGGAVRGAGLQGCGRQAAAGTELEGQDGAKVGSYSWRHHGSW